MHFIPSMNILKKKFIKYIKWRTLHFTDFNIFLIFASQKAPLNLALTSVPTERNGGSSKFT